ncbi:hypothetical protein CYMTET_35788, partial [Cymbomonas tetramitiformis]
TLTKETKNAGIQASPCPWTRFYFEEESTESGKHTVFKHFDVLRDAPPLPRKEKSLIIQEEVPQWLEEQWSRIYYCHLQDSPQTIAGTAGVTEFAEAVWPEVEMHSSKAICPPAVNLLDVGERERLITVENFCQYVARLKPRTPNDVKNLAELRLGLLTLLADQMSNAAGLFAERTREKEEQTTNYYQSVLTKTNDAHTSKLMEAKKEHQDEFGMVMRASNVLNKMKKSVAKKRQTQLDCIQNELQQQSSDLQSQLSQIPELQARIQELEEQLAGSKTKDARIAELEEQLAKANSSNDEKLVAAHENFSHMKEEMQKIKEELEETSKMAERAGLADEYFQQAQEAMDESAKRSKIFQQRMEEMKAKDDILRDQRNSSSVPSLNLSANRDMTATAWDKADKESEELWNSLEDLRTKVRATRAVVAPHAAAALEMRRTLKNNIMEVVQHASNISSNLSEDAGTAPSSSAADIERADAQLNSVLQILYHLDSTISLMEHPAEYQSLETLAMTQQAQLEYLEQLTAQVTELRERMPLMHHSEEQATVMVGMCDNLMKRMLHMKELLQEAQAKEKEVVHMHLEAEQSIQQQMAEFKLRADALGGDQQSQLLSQLQEVVAVTPEPRAQLEWGDLESEDSERWTKAMEMHLEQLKEIENKVDRFKKLSESGLQYMAAGPCLSPQPAPSSPIQEGEGERGLQQACAGPCLSSLVPAPLLPPFKKVRESVPPVHGSRALPIPW